MTENNNFRMTFIVALFLAAMAIVFSPVLYKLRHPGEQLTQYVDLKPGIDMVGGTSLVYEIKKPEGAHLTGKLASEVKEALERRVDPTGTRNLIWRPQGDVRLEIQMPMSPDAQNNANQRRQMGEQMIAAQDALVATNVTADAVTDAVEGKNGKSQSDLVRLAGDSKTRQKLFSDLASLWNQIQAVHAAHDAEKEASLRIDFDQKLHPAAAAGAETQSPIEETNLTRDQLEKILSPDVSAQPTDSEKAEIAQQRKHDLETLRSKFADFPSRLAAIDRFVKTSDQIASFKGAIDDATDLKRLLKGAGVLEYHILANDMPEAEYRKYADRLRAEGPRVRAGDEAMWYRVDSPKGISGRTELSGKNRYVLAYITPGPDGKPRSLDAHASKPWHLSDAEPETQPGSGERVVRFTFDPQGAVYFGELTEANVRKPMAIVLDNRVISAPVINSKITSVGTIDGGKDGFDNDELTYLVSTLKAGSLPATLSDEPISERTVGPQLGQDNLRHGLVACALGLVVVAVFMCSYYFLAGLVATVAVIMNVLLVLAVMSAFKATFTLPSIAGIVLSVGTAVDANVLIFERLREEQHRGLSLRLALRNAYGKAFSAIVDSNMTTFITSLFLIWFGTEEVKGFGVTLVIGIVASLFTALFVTRTIFSILIEKFGITTLRSVPLVFPKWDKALRPNIDWMSKAWAFIAFSIIGITVGLILFAVKVRQGEVMGIEFTSGTSVDFELAQPMSQDALRKIVEKNADAAALPSPSVVTVGNDQKMYEIVTPSSDAVRVRAALLKAIVDEKGQTLLKIDLPSKFQGTGSTLAEQLQHAVIPLEDKQTPAKASWPGGFIPDDVKDYEPGVAVVLNQLDPPLTTAQISDRIRQQQLQLPTSSMAHSMEFTVESPSHNNTTPTNLAVILCRNDALPYSKDKAKWLDSLAGPLWTLVNDSVNHEAQLQQIKNFDAQVASDATRDALLALILSIIVIMVYIWFRFGNFKYGTATMVALIHDVLFTVAALGFAHYLVHIAPIKALLQLDPFRIDLTVVAGILTIMGYSMIDTIVVFDRIRENRGKFGAVSRHVINDAINQTLSRTLLTAGTNVMTVAIMYFLGGPGIHGFTFVLLIGILVGTYSSVAIAAPILLLGRQDEEAATRTRGQLRTATA